MLGAAATCEALGTKTSANRTSVSTITFRMMSNAIVSPTEEIEGRFRRIHKVFSCTEKCRRDEDEFTRLTIIQQRYLPEENSEIC